MWCYIMIYDCEVIYGIFLKVFKFKYIFGCNCFSPDQKYFYLNTFQHTWPWFVYTSNGDRVSIPSILGAKECIHKKKYNYMWTEDTLSYATISDSALF